LNVLKLLLTDLMRGRHVVKRVGIVIAVSLAALFLSIGVLKVAGVLGFTIRDHAPLSFFSMLASHVLNRTGPIRPFVVPLLLLAFVGILLAVLNAAEMIDFFSIFRRRVAPRSDDFKSITLRRFKKRSLEKIHRCPDSSGVVYVIPAPLSAEPPAAWASSFLANWNEKYRDRVVRIYRDTIRFTSDLESVSTIWGQLKEVIDDTNDSYSKEVTKQREKQAELEEAETNRRAKESNKKWDTLKELN